MRFVKGGNYQPSFAEVEIKIADLEVGTYLVTQKFYQEIMGENPSKFVGDNKPVENVSWWDALKFCNQLSQREGLEPVYTILNEEENELTINQIGSEPVAPEKADFSLTEGYRLPTEAEWEWFARGGIKGQEDGTFNCVYSGSDDVDEVAWHGKNSGLTTHIVGTKKPNSLGIYDCSGNVWEWCYDTIDYDDEGEVIKYITKSTPFIFESSEEFRLNRGGSCGSGYDCELFYRTDSMSIDRIKFNGFRIVKTDVATVLSKLEKLNTD